MYGFLLVPRKLARVGTLPLLEDRLGGCLVEFPLLLTRLASTVESIFPTSMREWQVASPKMHLHGEASSLIQLPTAPCYTQIRQIAPIVSRMLIAQISFGNCATNGNSIITIRFSNCQFSQSRCNWHYSIQLSPNEKRITRFELELIFSSANERMIKISTI